jgi:hypothetical protein
MRNGRQTVKILRVAHVRPTAHTSPDGIAATLDNCSLAPTAATGTVTACQVAPSQCRTRLVRVPSDRACEPTAHTSLADLAETEVSVAEGALGSGDTATGAHRPPCQRRTSGCAGAELVAAYPTAQPSDGDNMSTSFNALSTVPSPVDGTGTTTHAAPS